MPKTTLEYVTEAAADVRRARAEYRRTLDLAHRAGNPVATIAAAAGVSRQAMYALLRRSGETSENGTEER